MTEGLYDYHTHNWRCGHASGHLEDYVTKAIAKGLGGIGLSDHFPMDFLPPEAGVQASDYSMDISQFQNYLDEAISLKKKYQDKIDVIVASEADYYCRSVKKFQKVSDAYLNRLDYLIGSVHVVSLDGIPRQADGKDNPELLRQKGVLHFYRSFYRDMTAMAESGLFQIAAHVDLPKKYGVIPDDLNVLHEMQAAFIETLKSCDMAMEINTSGLFRPAAEQYPSLFMIRYAVEKKLNIVLGSDAHHPDHVGREFDKMKEILNSFGYPVSKLSVNLFKDR